MRASTVVRAARARHDGSRRNPWNDIECGTYYARSMSAWQLVNAFSGLTADFVAGRLGFAPKAQGDFAAVLVGRHGAGADRVPDRTRGTRRRVRAKRVTISGRTTKLPQFRAGAGIIA